MSLPEVKLMLKTPFNTGDAIRLWFTCFELRKVKLADVDFDRKQLHVKDGKGRKDRYVPLSDHLIRGLKKVHHYR